MKKYKKPICVANDVTRGIAPLAALSIGQAALIGAAAAIGASAVSGSKGGRDYKFTNGLMPQVTS